MEPSRAAQPPYGAALVLLVAIFMALVMGAMRRTSATFDELLFPAAGARAMVTGDFKLVRDHPRLPQYLFGIPTWLGNPHYPAEDGTWNHDRGYPYARTFFFGVGNSPQKLSFVARLVSVLAGAGLVAATFLLSRRYLGAGAALVAATLVAFTPDVLAHSGVAYNDIPCTLALLLAVHAVDAALRAASLRRAAWAGVACGIALAMKGSALVLIPMIAGLSIVHALSGAWRVPAARYASARTLLLIVFVAYATLAVVYLGDVTLTEWRDCLQLNVAHKGRGHSEKDLDFPAYLLGGTSQSGWWYYFPVALAVKTPAAFHALIAVALAGAGLAWWKRKGAARANESDPWSSPLRAPAVAAVVMAVTLLTSHLDIGTRHALPLIPFACILLAAGLREIATRWRAGRLVIGALLGAQVGSVALAYPLFLPYITEWGRGRPAYELLADSSVDWGEGLLALRVYMDEHGIDQVALSYFGSAMPEGYGIHYHPLVSHFLLQGDPASARPPRYAAISLTNMAGNYLPGDPFARLRQRTPVAIVGGVFWIFDLEQ